MQFVSLVPLEAGHSQMLLLRSEHPDMTKQEEGCDLKHQINFLNVEGE